MSFDAGATYFLPELKPQIEWDIRLALRLAQYGTLKPQVGEYHWVESFKEVIDWANTIPEGEFRPMAVDLETLGLDEFHEVGRILTVQISYKPGHALVYKVPENGPCLEVFAQLVVLFNELRINTIGANLKYDMRWMAQKWGITVSNHRFDSQLVGGLLNENRHNSLKAHIKEYASELGGYEETIEGKWDKARMDIPLEKDPDGFLQYAGGDTDGELRIYTPLKNELIKDLALSKFYSRLLHPASLVFRKLESRGIVIDKPRYLELKKEAEGDAAEQQKFCFDLMPNKIKYQYADNLALTRDAIIRDFMFRSPYGLQLTPQMFTEKSDEQVAKGKPPQESTAWEHLKKFADHKKAGPFVHKLKEYNATKKTLDTYINGFLEHLRSDGRFHPSYILAKGGQAGDEDNEGGTNTGRSSCKSPAYQTWPKRTKWAKRLRSVVIPPPGYVIVKVDMSQGELRIMSDAANCKTMIEAYHKGLDLHAITAAEMMGLTLEQFWALPADAQEMGRYLAKACNFGLIYSISPEGLRTYAEANYGVVMSESEAIKYHAKFFKTYPEIGTYHSQQIKLARKYGYVRNQLGRLRHLPLINSPDGKTRGKQERQAINAPTQGCLFDMMMLTMVEIDRVRPDIWMFGNTHDSLEFYLKEDTWEDDTRLIKNIAEHLPLKEFNWYPKVPFVVDAEMSAINLGELKKVKLK